MGLEEVLPKQESSTNLRGPVPYEATTSSFLLGPPCGASIQAEELCSLFSKPMDENVSSLGGKDTGASQKPESGHSPGDSEVTEELGLAGTAPWNTKAEVSHHSGCLNPHLTGKRGCRGC